MGIISHLFICLIVELSTIRLSNTPKPFDSSIASSSDPFLRKGEHGTTTTTHEMLYSLLCPLPLQELPL